MRTAFLIVLALVMLLRAVVAVLDLYRHKRRLSRFFILHRLSAERRFYCQ
jgi:hypothetical protein